ncbi:GTPase IMAP family member 4-like [Mytilus trossulus]|uniref:GTPase IMAP family member 4-like n=1 Tax=Mytilus trossulus TaxID=6551 RepID=UPI003006CB6B
MANSCNDSDFIGFEHAPGRTAPSIHVPGSSSDELQNDGEIRIVLVGKIGVGKSSTGNMLLGKTVFKASHKSESVTKYTKSRRVTVNERSILIIDTPGLYDTEAENSLQHVQEEIKTCIKIGAPGIHAIVFILSTLTRFSMEDKDCIEKFFQIFGEEFYKYAVVVFTGADILRENNSNLKKYIGKNSVLKSFLQKCGNRYVPFNNKNPTPLEEETQRNHLIAIIIQLEESLQKYYTDRDFQAAETKLQEMEKDMRREKQEELRKQMEDLHVQFERKNAIEMDELEKLYHGKLITMRDEIRHQIEEENEKKKKSKKDEPIW